MLHHYSVHASLNIEHANMFYCSVKADWNRGQQHQASVGAGLPLAASLLMQLYRNLYENRKRRWTLTSIPVCESYGMYQQLAHI